MDAATLYRELIEAGLSESKAAAQVDYMIAYEYAKRRLQKQGLRREPTDNEIGLVLMSM